MCPGALVKFKNGYQTNITPRDKFEKVSEEELESFDPNWKPETPEDYYKKERYWVWRLVTGSSGKRRGSELWMETGSQ
jgi:hypothetical protein